MATKVADIDRGGFGRVEKWKNTRGIFFARKVFDPSPVVYSDLEIPKFKKRFHREVKVQSQLSSDFVVPVLAQDLAAEPPSFDMPFCDKTLESLKVSKTRTTDEVATALADVLNALEYLHSLGYVHRDLKPRNVLFHEGKWKLSDFGLVMPATGTTTALTSVGSAWGSAPYAAPEQAAAFGSVQSFADIYSFGCILHDFFGTAARIPYQRHSASGSVGLIIQKCTEVDPRRRFKSTNGLRAALLTCLSNAATLKPSATAAEWIKNLDQIKSWDQPSFETFVNFLEAETAPEDIDPICTALDEDKLSVLFSKAPEQAAAVAKIYCDWTDRPHIFSYCDVLVRRLELIFSLGDFELKAMAAISMAKLGHSHNRWAVMKRLVNVCGPSLQDDLANRIAVEIYVEDVKTEFRECAERIDVNITSFHQKIQKAIL